MPMIHSGASTHHHDHVITPVSLSTMSAGSARIHRLWPTFQIRSASNGSGFPRKVATTAPA